MSDAGACKKRAYYDNVVNLEIVPYDTTDVLGVGEVLPFSRRELRRRDLERRARAPLTLRLGDCARGC